MSSRLLRYMASPRRSWMRCRLLYFSGLPQWSRSMNVRSNLWKPPSTSGSTNSMIEKSSSGRFSTGWPDSAIRTGACSPEHLGPPGALGREALDEGGLVEDHEVDRQVRGDHVPVVDQALVVEDRVLVALSTADRQGALLLVALDHLDLGTGIPLGDLPHPLILGGLEGEDNAV